MEQRDRLFRVICGIKYTAIYGGLYVRRLEARDAVASALLGFAMSGAFCSFWVWEGHARVLAGVMLAVSLLQMLHARLGLGVRAARIRAACGLLESLYREGARMWRDAEESGDAGAYAAAADALEAREGELTAIGGTDVRNDDRLVAEATELMESQVKFVGQRVPFASAAVQGVR